MLFLVSSAQKELCKRKPEIKERRLRNEKNEVNLPKSWKKKCKSGLVLKKMKKEVRGKYLQHLEENQIFLSIHTNSKGIGLTCIAYSIYVLLNTKSEGTYVEDS